MKRGDPTTPVSALKPMTGTLRILRLLGGFPFVPVNRELAIVWVLDRKFQVWSWALAVLIIGSFL